MRVSAPRRIAASVSSTCADSADDIRHAHRFRPPAQPIAAARPAHALHQASAFELAEELLQVGLRDALPLGDFGQRDRLRIGVQGDIEQRRHGVAASGGQMHGKEPTLVSGAEY